VNNKMPDILVKRRCEIWAEAAITQFERLRAFFEQTSAHGENSGIYDSIFLLEALHQFQTYLEIAKVQFALDEPRINSFLAFGPAIRDLRNMNVHASDYLQGKGRAKSRYIADTPFQHSAAAVQIVSGVLWIDARLNVNECIDLIFSFHNDIDARNGRIWHPPATSRPDARPQ
jgi:hypothetical protein